MNRSFFGALGIVAMLSVVGSCKEDPLSDLDGNPATIAIDFDHLNMSVGDTTTVTATVLDGRATPLPELATFTACNADVSVRIDTSYHPVPVTSRRVEVAALSPNASCVVVEAGGLEDTVTISVLPLTFGGAASGTDLQPGDTLTLTATATLQFDPASSDVDFGGSKGTILSRTATELRILVPVSGAVQPAPLTVENVVLTYLDGQQTDLPTAAEFTITNPWAPNDVPPATANLTLPDTIFDGFLAGDADNFYKFTLGATTTFTVTLDWAGAGDLDILYTNAAGVCCVGNFDGATVANPETSTVTLTAGTYNLYINNFVSSGATPNVGVYRAIITVP